MHIRDIFSIFFIMKVCCVISLESPPRGDSNEYKQHIIFNKKKEKSPLNILSLPLWDFSKGLKNELETAVVDEPSVFEPLKFYCIFHFFYRTKSTRSWSLCTANEYGPLKSTSSGSRSYESSIYATLSKSARSNVQRSLSVRTYASATSGTHRSNAATLHC